MVLTPILKSATKSNKSNSVPSHVTFNLPQVNVVEYLSDGDIGKANMIIKQISCSTTENSLLLKWIADFKDNILILENNEGVIFALLNLNWYTKDDSFVRLYHDLILNIVTAYPSTLSVILAMIVRVFNTVLDPDKEVTEQETKMFLNAHVLLKNIIKLVPSIDFHLLPMLSEKFPYMKKPTKNLQCYVQNLLNISSYYPVHRLIILECIAEKLIHIDVHCSRDVIEMAEAEKEESQSQIVPMDMEAECTSKEESMAHPLAHTLDVILKDLYVYIENTCFSKDNKRLNWEATKKLYKELLTIFDKIILPTNGSCHVQFLMFYICSLKQDLSDGFLDFLWKKVQNPNIGPVYRQLATFYIGSLLTRAKFINISTVVACLDLMCNWIHSYIDNHTAQETSVHGTFHSVCQTVFYIFAFRSQELMEFDKGLKFLRSLNFERIVTCRLNPLRYCDRNIVQNFANIARNFQIAYVYPVIEKNNRNLMYAGLQSSDEYGAGSMIQPYFPFDPYLLKRSKKWIIDNYRMYNHCHKDDEAMDSVDDDDELNMGDSLFNYGTSPGFQKSFLSRR